VSRWLPLIALAVFGLVCGVAGSLFSTALVPNCGQDCDVEKLREGFLWGIVLLFAFPVIGALAFKKIAGGLKNTVRLAVLLFLAAVGPPGVLYGYELHQRYWKVAWQFEIPNVDFNTMVIATRPVEAIAHGKTSSVQVKAWERCVLGVVSCDKDPRTVEAICMGNGKNVLLAESDWFAFRRIPEEDLPGISGQPRDMNLCASRIQ